MGLISNFRKLGYKEFFRRWKEGIQEISPFQQTKTNLMGTSVILFGIVLGIIVTPIYRINGIWFWAEIILVGSMIVTSIQLLGIYQKYKRFKVIEEINKKMAATDGHK